MKPYKPSNERYARQLLLPEIGNEGQKKLAIARVLVIGAGGLGTPVLSYLAGAGVGHIAIVEHDRVALSNLQRQVLYETGDVGRGKARTMAERLRELNPDITVEALAERLTVENANTLLKGYDLVADCSDNFATRFVIADAALHTRIPLIFAAAAGFAGYITTFMPYLKGDHPCYRCLHPVPPPQGEPGQCEALGVVGPLVGILGSLQAMEILKLLTGAGENLSGRLLRYEGLSARFSESRLHRDPACPACAKQL